MRIANVNYAATPGPRPEMQDELSLAYGSDGIGYFGVFDGHGPSGDVFAALVSRIVPEIAAVKNFDTANDVIGRAKRIREALRYIHEDYRQEPALATSGTTATIAAIGSEALTVTWVGDSEAVYYPLDKAAIRLVEPDNGDNSKEIERVQLTGGYVREGTDKDPVKRFGGVMAISRSIGDYEYSDFMVPDAHISHLGLQEPGTLVIASDGVWGLDEEDHSLVEEVVRRSIAGNHDDTLAEDLVATFAARTSDNASCIAVKFEQ